MNWIGRIGRITVEQGRQVCYVTAVIWGVLVAAIRPRYWPRTVRSVLMRQIYHAGVQGVFFVLVVALIVGGSVVMQAQFWLSQVGQSTVLGALLVAVVIRELAPLLVNLVMIGRSGSAIATELANMTVSGEIHALDAQGVDPFIYVVVPRVLAVAISVGCLTAVFVIASLASGYLCGLSLGLKPGPPLDFADSILRAIRGSDVLTVLAKSAVPALVTGAVCCTEGLSVRRTITDVPRVTTRALSRAVLGLFTISVSISILGYL